jgi:NitT/TauT family transport system permease protein
MSNQDLSIASTASAPTSPRAAKPSGEMPQWLVVSLTTAVLLFLWEASVRLLEVPQFIVPTPSDVIRRIWDDLATGVILPHLWITFVEVIVGFAAAAVLGIALGTGIALVRFLDRTVYPFALALQTIPKVAVAPLLIIWFGYGIQSKIVTAALLAFFPILVNVVAGLRTGDPRRLLLMRALRAGPVKTYVKVRLPAMLPYLFAGLEVGAVLAVIGAVVGEFIGASQGLGSVIIQRQASVDVTGVFSVLFYLSAMGVLMSVALRIVARRYAFWSDTSSQAAN